MLSLLWSIAIILAVIVLAYNRASALVSTIAGVVGLTLVSVLSPFSPVTLVILWLALIVYAVIFNATPWRKQYFAKPLLSFYQKILPKMSKTEKEAISAGTVQWAGELFSGAPDWHAMLKRSGAKLSAEEQEFLDGPVETLCTMLNDWDITHNRADLPPEVWQFIKENKFFAMIIPKEYGGLAFSATANSEVVAKIAAVSTTCATTICVPNSLGPAELLHKYGTQSQKDYYLPRLAVGDEIPCFALTGPNAGSDATSIPDLGVVCKGNYDDKEVLGIRLNFNKRYITLAPIATVIGLAFKMLDPNGLLGTEKELGITCALLPRDTKGISIGRRHFPLNTPFLNGPIQGKDVFIPLDFIIGGAKMAGKGWTMLVECLSVGRGISLPAIAVGGSKAGVLAGGAYCRVREQFGLPIGKFEGVQEAFVRAVSNLYIMDSARKMTIATIDRGEKPAVLTAISKAHITEMGRQVSMDIMDIHGGKGICLGPNNYLGRTYQGVPISITVEGANILTRSMIIFGQGAIRCHPYVIQEMHAVAETDANAALKVFDKAIFGHMGFIFSNFVRSLTLAFTSAQVVIAPEKSTRRYYQHLTRFSSAFALLADMAMASLGGELKRKESLSARLGDILSQLYLGSAVLKRFHDDGSPSEDLVLVKYACQNIFFNIQTAFDGVLRNLPNRALAAFLRVVIFPTGQHFAKPGDKLSHKVAKLFLEPSETRSRVTKGLSLNEEAHHPLGRIEATLKAVIAIEPLEKKIKVAVKEGNLTGHNYNEHLEAALRTGLITESEHEQILEAHEMRMALINVDDFDSSELALGRKKSSKNKALKKQVEST